MFSPARQDQNGGMADPGLDLDNGVFVLLDPQHGARRPGVQLGDVGDDHEKACEKGNRQAERELAQLIGGEGSSGHGLPPGESCGES